MASQVMRITLKAYDHELVDTSAKKIIETVKKMCIRDRCINVCCDHSGTAS